MIELPTISQKYKNNPFAHYLQVELNHCFIWANAA